MHAVANRLSRGADAGCASSQTLTGCFCLAHSPSAGVSSAVSGLAMFSSVSLLGMHTEEDRDDAADDHQGGPEVVARAMPVMSPDAVASSIRLPKYRGPVMPPTAVPIA